MEEVPMSEDGIKPVNVVDFLLEIDRASECK